MLWRLAQVTGVALTVALLYGLLVWPDTSLKLLWSVAVPVLPASFLVAPALWRNTCPLATLNTLTARLGKKVALEERWIPAAGITGIALLLVLVPARRFLFNTDGPVLAAVIAAVAVLALAAGLLFDLKAGFCNAICPVLPVERLYGQQPLMGVGNPRCSPCTLCTRRGCLDLSPEKSIAQTLGRSRRSGAWLATGYGVFAAAFPGFVAGYYLSSDVPVAQAFTVYARVLAWSLASYGLTWAAVRALSLRSDEAMALLGGLAVGLYYWFAPAAVSAALHLSPMAVTSLRAAFLSLVLWWLGRALMDGRPRGAPIRNGDPRPPVL